MSDNRRSEGPRTTPTDQPMPDFEAMSRNMALLVEEYGKATAAYLKPLEERRAKTGMADEMSDMVKTLVHVTERWLIDPQKASEAQARLGLTFFDVWSSSLRRMQGEDVAPATAPEPKDSRFADAEWSDNAYFDFLKQAYLATSRWAESMVEEAEGIDDATRQKARFYVRQMSSALSPSNFLTTNPELIRETLRESGANLVRGMHMLAEDIEAGDGELKIRQSDPSRFKVGENLATTPGKVIFRNELIELLQYAPTTETVLRRPLLIVPPWINKFYILDLNEQKSFIRWAVSQGLTVFCISWVNPDARLAEKSFEHYMREGVFAALDAIEQATGEKKVTAIGYCVGGTLLSTALGYMAATKDDRIDSATLFTTQVDFTHAGDLKVFADEAGIRAIEDTMKARGYLEGSRMASAFNMLRPNDLIWPYIINVYLKGQAPLPLRPPVLELRFDPHACGEPLVLPAQLLSREQPEPGQGRDRWQEDRPEEGDDPDLQPRHQGGPHRPGAVGLRGLLGFRRQRRVRDGGVGPHRRRRQPALQAQVPVLDRAQARWRVRGLGGERRGASRHLVALLGLLDRGPGPRARPRPHARRREAGAAVRRAGDVRAGEELRGPRSSRVSFRRTWIAKARRAARGAPAKPSMASSAWMMSSDASSTAKRATGS